MFGFIRRKGKKRAVFRLKRGNYRVRQQEIIPEESVIDFEFVNMETEEDYDRSSRFGTNVLILFNSCFELGEIEMMAASPEEPPAFFHRLAPADPDREIVIERDMTLWAKCSEVDEGILIWLPVKVKKTVSVECGDVVFYLDREKVVGILIRNKKAEQVKKVRETST